MATFNGYVSHYQRVLGMSSRTPNSYSSAGQVETSSSACRIPEKHGLFQAKLPAKPSKYATFNGHNFIYPYIIYPYIIYHILCIIYHISYAQKWPLTAAPQGFKDICKGKDPTEVLSLPLWHFLVLGMDLCLAFQP